jgi:hypothetical protein
MAQLCLSYAELDNLIERLQYVERTEEALDPPEREELEEVLECRLGARQAQKAWQKFDYIMSIYGILALNKALDAKRSLIRSLEDRMFLNPAAKIKNVPKNPPKKKAADPLESAGFGNV